MVPGWLESDDIMIYMRYIGTMYLYDAPLMSIDSCLNKYFPRSSLKLLGHIIDKFELHTDPDKVEAITWLAKPTTTIGVKRFIGMIGWYLIHYLGSWRGRVIWKIEKVISFSANIS